jgi:hypothetical protein
MDHVNIRMCLVWPEVQYRMEQVWYGEGRCAARLEESRVWRKTVIHVAGGTRRTHLTVELEVRDFRYFTTRYFNASYDHICEIIAHIAYGEFT